MPSAFRHRRPGATTRDWVMDAGIAGCVAVGTAVPAVMFPQYGGGNLALLMSALMAAPLILRRNRDADQSRTRAGLGGRGIGAIQLGR